MTSRSEIAAAGQLLIAYHEAAGDRIAELEAKVAELERALRVPEVWTDDEKYGMSEAFKKASANRLAEIVMRFDVLMAEQHPEHWMPEHARLIEQLRKLGRWKLPVHRSEVAAILTDKPRRKA